MSTAQIWILSLFIKLVLGAILPFFSDEAYYWVWSHNLQLSYFDHPPMVAWFFKLGQVFENFGQASRWFGILVAHSAILVWLKILEGVLTENQKRWWLYLVLLNPLLGPGSLILTPDIPLIFFWTLSVYFFKMWIEKATVVYAALLGASLGLGFCSKYHIVLFLPMMFIWLLIVKPKPQIKFLHVCSVIFFGLLLSSPVFIWNFQNNFDSFRFQLNRGLNASHWTPSWFFAYIGGQAALIFPPLIWIILKGMRSIKEKWLLNLAFFPLVFFGLTSIKGPVEANWTMVGFPALMAVILLAAKDMKLVTWSVRIWAASILLAISLVYWFWLPFDERKLKLSEHKTYDQLLAIARSYTPFYASSYQMASTLSYKLRTPIYKLRGIGRRDVYDYLENSMPKENNFFVVLQRWDQLPEWTKDFIVTPREEFGLEFRFVELTRK